MCFATLAKIFVFFMVVATFGGKHVSQCFLLIFVRHICILHILFASFGKKIFIFSMVSTTLQLICCWECPRESPTEFVFLVLLVFSMVLQKIYLYSQWCLLLLHEICVFSMVLATFNRNIGILNVFCTFC